MISSLFGIVLFFLSRRLNRDDDEDIIHKAHPDDDNYRRVCDGTLSLKVSLAKNFPMGILESTSSCSHNWFFADPSAGVDHLVSCPECKAKN